MICYILISVAVYLYSKKNYLSSLMIFYFLLLEGFQFLPQNILTLGFYSGSTIDGALLILIILLFFRGKLWFKTINNRISFKKYVNIFLIYLLLNCIYGLLIKDYSLGEIFKGFRNYLFISSFLLFVEVPENCLFKLIKILTFITLIQCLLFCLQVFTGVTLLQGAESLYVDDLDYVRYYNIPKLLDFLLAILIFYIPFKTSVITKYGLIILAMITVIAPLHRGYMVAWVISVMSYILFFEKSYYKIVFLSLIPLFVIVVLSVDKVNIRIIEAIDQISILENVLSTKVNYEENTFLYRIGHLVERYQFIMAQPMGWIFGIGIIDDSASQIDNLPLKFGLPDRITGKLIKVYTPDIAWSMIVLTLGIVGTLLYVNIYLKILSYATKTLKYNSISKVIFILVILGFFMSFTSNVILLPSFVVPVMMLTVYSDKIEAKKSILVNDTNYSYKH